jgi:hypothetical protein
MHTPFGRGGEGYFPFVYSERIAPPANSAPPLWCQEKPLPAISSQAHFPPTAKGIY